MPSSRAPRNALRRPGRKKAAFPMRATPASTTPIFSWWSSAGKPARISTRMAGAAYESLARIFGAAEGIANRDRDHQRRQGREALECFRAKWEAVCVKKTRQSKKREPGSDAIRTDQAPGFFA